MGEFHHPLRLSFFFFFFFLKRKAGKMVSKCVVKVIIVEREKKLRSMQTRANLYLAASPRFAYFTRHVWGSKRTLV